MQVVDIPVSELVPYSGNAKMHPEWQVRQIADSIEEFGNLDPIAVWRNADGALEVVEGHGRLLALRMLGAETAPAVVLDHLTDKERRAYALVHNKLAKDTGFDWSLLEDELANLSCDFAKYGFDVPETDPGEIVGDTGGEIDPECPSEERFAHECEACGFKFN